MQVAILWMTLVLAHLLGDFVLQRGVVVQGKAGGSKTAYAEHGAIHFISMIIMLTAFVGSPVLQPRTIGILIIVVFAHLGLDAAKERIGTGADEQVRRWPFIVDQVLHILVITVAVIAIVPVTSLAGPSAFWTRVSNQALVLACGYTAVVIAAGHLNAVLLKPFSELYNLPDNYGQDNQEGIVKDAGLARAGMIIGILERFLILTAVLANSPAGVGLVVAAKSVFRFQDANKDRQNAEYFLIGTFLSVTEAVIGGIIIRRLLYLITNGA